MERMSLERSLDIILEEWSVNDGKCICTYFESQLLVEYLLESGIEFKVTYKDDEDGGKTVVSSL